MNERDNGKSNGGNFWAALRVVVPVMMAVLLPFVGFIASNVIQNHTDIVEVRSKIMTTKDALALIRAHEQAGTHRGYVPSDIMTGALKAMEKQQALRDEQIRRELAEIKAELKTLRTKGGK